MLFRSYLPASDKVVLDMKDDEETVFKGTGTILLVDDEEMITEIGRELLTDLGYDVFVAKNGLEAVDIYQNAPEKFDLVILDMIMPGISGSVTFQRLKAIDPQVRVLLSSGYSISNQASELLAQGCADFIEKPFSQKKLSMKIKNIISS